MPTYNFNKTLLSTNRVDIRLEVTNWFLQEEPGTSNKELCSYNNYYVEEYNNYSIVLRRPAYLNKGFDFTVNTIGIKYCKKRKGAKGSEYDFYYEYPSHDDVIKALLEVKENNEILYNDEIKPVIEKLYNCDSIKINWESKASFHTFDERLIPIEIMLLAIKWLFIEQDITYWNWSGRKKLYNSLKEKNLV